MTFPSRIGDGSCSGGYYNKEECRWDGGDCEEFNKYPDCNVPQPFLIGNVRYNDEEYNTEDCGWDGGDCEEFMQIIPTALCPVQLGLAINIVRVQSITLKNADLTVEIAYDSIDCPVKKQ